MAQMTILTRQDIEGCLKRGMSVPQIATRVGKTPQAITAELKTQKPHVERNHEELRRILVKGTSFDGLDQDDVNVSLSHINSYTRLSLGNSKPYDEFVKLFAPSLRPLCGKV